jgi:NitT/TauT family transport system ATP-binding protein
MTQPQESLLSLERITQRFVLERGRDIQVLKNINITVYDREVVAFLGPSGCGKTTTLKIMAGLLRPSEGIVLQRGRPLEGINSQLSMVFQNYALLPWFTVEQNVGLGLHPWMLSAKQIDARIEESIEIVGLGGFEEAYPSELSGGMRQRVGMARALAVRPQILCLDEPFSAVDVLTAENLRAEVLEIWQEQIETVRSVVLVTHDIFEAVMMAQRIIVFGADPGHVRTVLNNQLAYPRNPKDPKISELIDVIHSVLTEALIPEETQKPALAQPSWYQGLENLPAVTPGEIVGLLEVLDDAGGKMDIFMLANETESEFGHSLAVTKTAEILDLVETPKQMAVLTDLGRKFIRADSADRKDLFAAQIRNLRIIQTVLTWLEESQEHEIERDAVIARLQTYFPNQKVEQLFDTLVAFGRYAEVLAFNSKLDMLTLPEEEENEATVSEAESNDSRSE